ncbi:MAG TPA: nucleotide pyrophosphohydrolase [Noviherbaspirillum sp.]|nr:nucleotide pyrophosphohydrolase [Noviherbaspirillum sp.]
MNDLDTLTQMQLRFRDARNWKQFHSLRNLIVSLNLEAAELLELTQWKDDAALASALQDAQFREMLRDECADVLLYLVLVAEAGGVDLMEAARAKIAKNALKYPVEKAYGSARKGEAGT